MKKSDSVKNVSEQPHGVFSGTDQRLKQVLDCLPAFIGVLKPDGVIIEANLSALESARLSPRNVLGKRLEDTYWWLHSAETQSRIRTAINQARSGEVVKFEAMKRVD